VSAAQHTPGPWPWAFTGDGKRIVVGVGLVEGPNGYDVAEALGPLMEIIMIGVSVEISDAELRAAHPEDRRFIKRTRAAMEKATAAIARATSK